MADNLLNDRKIKSAKPTDKEYFLADGRGLYLRVRPAGDKLWLMRYTNLTGRKAKKSLGPYPELSLFAAREKNLELRAALLSGVDPKSIVDGKPATVQALFDTWVKDDLPRRREERGIYRLKLRMEKHVLPHIGKDAISTVTRSKVLQVLLKVVNLGQGPQANMLLADVRQMFDYAVAHEWLDFNRTSGIEKRDVGGQDVVGDRVIDEIEVSLLADALTKPTGITPQCYASIWLCFSTLARIEELVTAEKHEIDWEKRVWTIPASKNKSTREHVVHLSDFAFHFFNLLNQIPGGNNYLFASSRSPIHVRPKALNFQINQRQFDPSEVNRKSCLRPEIQDCMRLPNGRWSHHSLRRSGATLMGELGISEEIIEKCLNHSSKKRLVRTYQKHQNLAERKEAFERLGQRLEELTGIKVR